MGAFTSIAAAICTRDRRFSGGSAWPWLVINQGDADCVNQTVLPPQAVGRIKRGECLYYYETLPLEGLSDLRDDLTGPGDLYVRLVTCSSDLWEPELALVWGRSREKGIIPLALDMDLPHGLSCNKREGFPSVPIRRVSCGADDRPIHRLLLVLVTFDAPYAGTDDPISLSITTDRGPVVHHVVTDTPQTDLEIDTANIYDIPVNVPFTKGELAASEAGEMALGIRGSDKWAPKKLFLFGLDEASGQPNHVVPLARMIEPGPLSLNASEGVPAISLTPE
jgi:hypothetical protein